MGRIEFKDYDELLLSAKGTTFFGVPLRDLSHDDLLVVIAWMEEYYTEKVEGGWKRQREWFELACKLSKQLKQPWWEKIWPNFRPFQK